MIVKSFNNFINENMDQAKSIISKKMKAFEKLKDLLSKNMGYIGKFTEYLMSENISYEQLEELYKKIIDLKSKNVTLDISKLTYEKALDKAQDSYNDLSVNSLISKFPSLQKSLAREAIKNNSSNFNILLKVSKKDNLEAFISKVARYKSKEQLLDALKLFSKDAKNNREYVKSILPELKSKIVFENNEIMIVYVPKHEDIKVLGSDTSWCIVGGMWSRYTTGRYQYILYNYDLDEYNPLFKIGFTLNPNGSVHAAHDILDGPCSQVLEAILAKNNITKINLITGLGDIEGAVKKIEVKDIKANTSIASIELLTNSSDKETLALIVKKLLQVYKWNKTLGFERSVSDGRKNLLVKTVKQLFAGVDLIDREKCNAVDESLFSFVNYYKGSFTNFFNKDFFSWNLPPNVLLKVIDKWTDETIIKGAGYSSDLMVGGYIDYTKPIDDSKFRKGIEATKKLSDRLNKIYKDKSYLEYEGKINLSPFFSRIVFLNYVLGRPEACPKELLKYANNNSYPGLFEKEIDISGQSILGFLVTDYPIENIKKKDYQDAYINIGDWRTFIRFIPRILRHLNGYKLVFKVGKNNLKDITTRANYGTIPETDIVYLKKMQDIMRKFPQRLVKGKKVTEGNITIEVV